MTREENRARFPAIAAFVDQMRAEFGADVKVECIKQGGVVVLGKEKPMPDGWVRVTAREWLAHTRHQPVKKRGKK